MSNIYERLGLTKEKKEDEDIYSRLNLNRHVLDNKNEESQIRNRQRQQKYELEKQNKNIKNTVDFMNFLGQNQNSPSVGMNKLPANKMSPNLIQNVENLSKATKPKETKNLKQINKEFKSEEEKLQQIKKEYEKTRLDKVNEILTNNNQAPIDESVNPYDYGFKKESSLDIKNRQFNKNNKVKLPGEDLKYLPTFKEAEKSENVQEKMKNINEQTTKLAYLEQNKNAKEVEETKVNWFDKSFGRVLSGGLSLILRDENKYKAKDKNGKTLELPTKNDLMQQKISNSYDTKTGKFLGDAGYNIGKQLGAVAGNAALPGLGTGAYWLNMFMENERNARIEGYDSDRAALYAATNTLLEFGTEKTLGGLTKGLTGGKSSALEEQIKKATSKLISNETFSNFISKASSEAIEEFTQEYLDNINKLVTLEGSTNIADYRDALLSTDTLSDALYSAGIGAVSGGTMGAFDSKVYGNDNITNQQMQETTTNMQDIANTQDIKYSITNNNQNINENIFTYTKTDNQKVNNLYESAVNSQFQDTKTAHNFIDSLAKIVKDKDVDIVFDSTLSENINGKYENGKISINPKSTRAGEFIAIHELTHSIGTDTMRNIVDNYRKSNQEFDNYLQNKLNNYKTSELSEEAMSDVLGNVLGNQEYINSLSMKQPNLFKKIYQEVKYLYHQLRGYKNQSQFIEDLMYKFESAYRKNGINLNEISSFSIQQDEQGNKYVNVDTDQDIFDGKTLSEQTRIAKKYILDNFRANGLIQNSENINVTSRTANEYTHPKNKNSKDVTSSKMKASTELNNLLEVSTYSHSNDDDGRHSIAKDGWDYYKVNFRVGNQNFEGLINIAKNGNKKTLYDITRIKKTSRVGSDNKSTTTNVTSFNNSTIPQSNENVNSTTKYSTQNDVNNTQNSDKWQEYLDKNFKSTGTRTNMQDIRLPQKPKDNLPKVTNPNLTKSSETKNLLPMNEEIRNSIKNKTMDPIEISKLTKEDASTTPKLNDNLIKNKYNDGESKFWNNIANKTNMLNKTQKGKILSENEVKYYDKVTNKESLERAFKRLEEGGQEETLKWFNKSEYNKDMSVDVAEGYILMKQYSDSGDYDSMVAVVKKMRQMGTAYGQGVQAFNIMERMTPEGMVKYAQSELSEAYDKMVKNKSKEWIDKHRSDFDLKPDEVKFIMNNMKEVSKMEDGYDKRVKLAEIQKLMTDKLPTEKGKAIKSWMRISMLFNPKTQVRNVVGNALIMPVNNFSDLFSSYADKLISKKTGVRTTGKVNVKAQLKGFKEGAYQATNDYRKGINTKDMEGNRFEIGDGKSFNDKRLIGKSLNRVEGLLNYVMDAGDRMFSQAAFENSLQNQLILNNTTEITQDMIDIARTESLQRTWNDNNGYTKFVLDIRRGINKIHYGQYGLGDILIPFAKTPANLTKAIVDYSPAGLVTTIVKGNNLRKSIYNGQYTPQMQHKFVQTLGKATAGTMLYILGAALAKAGITTGDSDEDKDTANFLKNTLGISSYSINIGGKSFTYDWAQPIAAPLSITANIVNSKNKKQSILESIVSNLDTAGSILLEQSFLQSLNDVFNGNEDFVTNLINEMLELPARAIPTFSKQIVDMTDSTQRTSYEYGKPLQTAINSMKAKIPGLSKTLAPSVDTMGREIQRYGGKNNIFNVFLNPANVNTENISESAEEIYRLYKSTGDKTIMPRVAPYYINSNEKVILTSQEKAEYQKISGKIIEDNVKHLMNDSNYKKMNDDEKIEIIKSIVDYSYNKAREEVKNIPMSKNYNKVSEYVSNGGKVKDYYLNKEEINYSLENPEKYNTITQITTYEKYQEYKKEIDEIRDNSNNKKMDTMNYINSLKLNIPQKAMFIKMYYSSFNDYDDEIISYINKNVKSKNEKENILSNLGFTINDGKVYTK